MPITAPTPPTPPTPPQKLESKTNWAVELHPPVPRFSFGNRKSAPAQEVEEESYDEEFEEESGESEEVESVEEESEPVAEEPNPLQIARDRVQTYHRSEDGKSESTSTQSREPLQTNNRIPGEVRPEEITRDAADARGKLIVEQFRKLEEMKDQKESQQSQTQSRQSIDVPHINPSDHKSSLGTVIFTFAAIMVLAIVAFFTLRKSRLQKRRAELESKKDLQTPEQTSEQTSEQNLDQTSESDPIQDPIPKPRPIPATKIRTAYSTPRDDSKPKSQPKSQPIPTAKIKSVDRNPAEPKIKGNFEIRV